MRLATSSATRLTWAIKVKSARTIVKPPSRAAAAISASAAALRRGSRPTPITCQPSAASLMAVDFPIPELAPVTSATRRPESVVTIVSPRFLRCFSVLSPRDCKPSTSRRTVKLTFLSSSARVGTGPLTIARTWPPTIARTWPPTTNLSPVQPGAGAAAARSFDVRSHPYALHDFTARACHLRPGEANMHYVPSGQ